MRAAVADYVTALHRAYLAQADTFPPAVRGAMPLLAGGPLHGRRRRGAQPAPAGDAGGARAAARAGGGGRRVAAGARLDAAVLRPRGRAGARADRRGRAGPRTPRCGRALGITTVVYHVVAQPGSGLTPHHAGHVGAGLASGHSAAARDFETIRTRVPRAGGAGRRAGRGGRTRASPARRRCWPGRSPPATRRWRRWPSAEPGPGRGAQGAAGLGGRPPSWPPEPLRDAAREPLPARSPFHARSRRERRLRANASGVRTELAVGGGGR